MKKFAYSFFISAVALFGMTFSYKNRQEVAVQYYFGVDWRAELPLMLFAAFACGVLLGWLGARLRVVSRNWRRR